ncbi:carboxymuconolactone decarboxylase family protein [Amycolatopsis sp. YIM 10]|uniref:carboxymuconolactone decarboxylase family protein n=1 Tax=Amycolatopsis sp. YIM 10 TaxID=2653857 RepID=UPI0012903884|nr:carboxymuconolactone decarboxylase family protein [Amycolatopsis sp. YIM 10]QFU91756.1 Carboxymuconolactone decarboxylase family protein [Amycolatopsis sp. YIM 10]
MTDSDRGTTANRRTILTKGALLSAGALGVTAGAAAPASAETDRYARGLAALRRISGERGTEVIESLRDIAPDLGRYIVEFAFGDIYTRPGLDAQQRQLVTIGALAAQGDTRPQLDFHLDAALRVGVHPVEIMEAIVHLAPFTGFPRVLNAVTVAREVFTERGITFEPPVQTDQRDRYERGEEKLVEIDGQHGLDVIESLRDIAPDLGRYIVEFAFGDIYYRPWLSPRRRQLVTVGALTAFGDTAGPLRVHLGAALNVGLSRAQVIEALIHIVSYAGFPRVLNAITAAREVFERRPS